MRKIFTLCLILIAGSAVAQPYNNEWIDYSKTYYKFKITADGLYRIPASVLAGAGLRLLMQKIFNCSETVQEVPVYTSVSSGPLSPTDYIEFWGQMNDGAADKPLYRNPAYQHTTKWSLQSDTAVYFLTLNPSGSPFHYNTVANDTSTNILPPEPYFMYTTGTYLEIRSTPGRRMYLNNIFIHLLTMWVNSGVPISLLRLPGFTGTPVTDNQNNLVSYTTADLLPI